MRRLMAAGIPQMRQRHGVSEALYLRDYDQNGVRDSAGSAARVVAGDARGQLSWAACVSIWRASPRSGERPQSFQELRQRYTDLLTKQAWASLPVENGEKARPPSVWTGRVP